jgi:hypothetical protein
LLAADGNNALLEGWMKLCEEVSMVPVQLVVVADKNLNVVEM